MKSAKWTRVLAFVFAITSVIAIGQALPSPTFLNPTFTGTTTLADTVQTKTLPAGGGQMQVNTASGAISSPAGPVWMASFNQVNNFSSANVTGGGHQVGVFGMAYNDAASTTNALAIGVEGTIGNNNGTITRANSLLGTLNQNASGKTIALWVGANGVPTNNAGTLTKAQGFRAEVTSGNTGTIGEWNGFYNADASSGVGTITTRYAFVNDDPGAVFKSKTPFVDSSYVAYTPANGGTTNVATNTGFVLLNSGSTIASHTLTLPSTPTDGLCITFFNVNTITTVTVNSSGNSIFGAPSTLGVNAFFTMKFLAGLSSWARVARAEPAANDERYVRAA